MEQTDNVVRNIFGRLKEKPTFVFVILSVILLFIFPGFLPFLIPVIAGAYVKKPQTTVSGASGAQQPKRKDPRRYVLAGLILLVSLLIGFVVVGLDWNNFMSMVMLIGICTGGFVWAPLAAYLVARFLLFVYDKITGNIALAETAPYTTTASPLIVSATALAPTVTQAPTLAPDLSALSSTDQSLVIYIAEASARGVMGGEITLILKSTGWLDADIARGFELTRTYYPGVLK